MKKREKKKTGWTAETTPSRPPLRSPARLPAIYRIGRLTDLPVVQLGLPVRGRASLSASTRLPPASVDHREGSQAGGPRQDSKVIFQNTFKKPKKKKNAIQSQ